MFSACACMGLIGRDPYCPCEMKRRGLKSDSEWTEEEKARLNEALSAMFGWKEVKRDHQQDN